MSLYEHLKGQRNIFKEMNLSKMSHSDKKLYIQEIQSSSKTDRSGQSAQSQSQHRRVHTELDFQLHDPEKCVCKSCDCGQHHCKIHIAKPQLRNSTTYKNSFNNAAKTVTNLKKEQIALFTPNQIAGKVIDHTTTYQQKFNQKVINVRKPIKNQDHQKFEGPSLQITTYQQKYPGYNGKNPYVKTKPDQFRGGLRFKGQSTYSKQFLSINMQKTKPIKQSVSLKTEGSWMGRSSYQEAFKTANPERLRPINYKPKELQYDKRPSSAYQYQSSYKRGYENPFSNRGVNHGCPAKELLVKLSRGGNEKDVGFKLQRREVHSQVRRK